MTARGDGITFELERLAVAPPGQLEVSGRWYGVRGRRFMRPTLILTSGDSEQRMLADLEHKPWAAQDGEVWRAVFPSELALEEAGRLELVVAPDITVELAQDAGVGARPRRRAAPSSATGARSPVVRQNPVRPRPRPARSPEVERLHERLDLAETTIIRERGRREAADTALETERQAGRRLQAELGRARAELELAGTLQRELDTASAALDSVRGETRTLGRDRDQIVRERDDARRELDEERAGARRLRGQLADAEAAVRRLTQPGRETRPPTAGARVSTGARSAAPEARTGASAALDTDSRWAPYRGEPGADDTIGLEPTEGAGGEGREPPRTAFGAVPRANPSERPRSDGLDRTPAPPPRTERPLNPSLRGSNWLGRLIALVVMVIVIAAIIVVINSTLT